MVPFCIGARYHTLVVEIDTAAVTGSVRVGRQDFRAVDLAGLRHVEPLVCETALAQGVPGFSLLSERHGECVPPKASD